MHIMKINILIVDDSRTSLLYLQMLLESMEEDVKITTSSTGHEALDIVKKEKIDLILLDVHMPDMDGFEVAKVLKDDKRTKHIPIVFLTASANLKTVGFELGAVDYLTKPIDENQFKSRISLYIRLVKAIEYNRSKDQFIQEQSRMAQMGEMISMIAHQWRQPLATIASIYMDIKIKSEFKQYDLKKINEAQEYESYVNNGLDEINNLVQNLTKTIDGFRNFYKPNKQSQLVNIDELAKKSLEIVKMSLVNNNIEIL